MGRGEQPQQLLKCAALKRSSRPKQRPSNRRRRGCCRAREQRLPPRLPAPKAAKKVHYSAPRSQVPAARPPIPLPAPSAPSRASPICFFSPARR